MNRRIGRFHIYWNELLIHYCNSCGLLYSFIRESRENVIYFYWSNSYQNFCWRGTAQANLAVFSKKLYWISYFDLNSLHLQYYILLRERMIIADEIRIWSINLISLIGDPSGIGGIDCYKNDEYEIAFCFKKIITIKQIKLFLNPLITVKVWDIHSIVNCCLSFFKLKSFHAIKIT